MPTPSDQSWMRRAVRLASLSLGHTCPNPGVGCVIVRDGVVLGEGRHESYGQAHAEVNALADCQRRGHDPAGATAYVTLAPCTRTGRTPPCCAALAAARIGRVVAAIVDPNQDDAAPRLAAAGIAYHVGCCAELAAHLHGGFLSCVMAGRARFTGKWAMTSAGAITAGAGRWISSAAALAFSRRRRRAFDGILIGAGTARIDDPQLLAVPARCRGPVRILVSARPALAGMARLLATTSQAPLWLVHGPQATAAELQALRAAGGQTLAVADAHDPLAVARRLGDHKLNDVLVEGGATIHRAWLAAGLYDRLELYLAAGTPGVASGGWHHEEPPRRLDGTVCLRLRWTGPETGDRTLGLPCPWPPTPPAVRACDA